MICQELRMKIASVIAVFILVREIKKQSREHGLSDLEIWKLNCYAILNLVDAVSKSTKGDGLECRKD